MNLARETLDAPHLQCRGITGMKIGHHFTRNGIKYVFLGHRGTRWRVRKVGSRQTEYILADHAAPPGIAKKSPRATNRNIKASSGPMETVWQQGLSEDDVAFSQVLESILNSLSMLEEWWEKEPKRLAIRLKRRIASPEVCQRELDAFGAHASRTLDRVVRVWQDALARYCSERNERRMRKEAESLTMTDPYLRQALVDHYIEESKAEAGPVQHDNDSDESGES